MPSHLGSSLVASVASMRLPCSCRRCADPRTTATARRDHTVTSFRWFVWEKPRELACGRSHLSALDDVEPFASGEADTYADGVRMVRLVAPAAKVMQPAWAKRIVSGRSRVVSLDLIRAQRARAT